MSSITSALPSPFLEHLQHAIGDQIAADQVDRGCDHSDEAEHLREWRRILLTGDQNRADNRDRRNRVRQRHQRSMQKRRNIPNQLESEKSRQHENPESVFVFLHDRHRLRFRFVQQFANSAIYNLPAMRDERLPNDLVVPVDRQAHPSARSASEMRKHSPRTTGSHRAAGQTEDSPDP